MNLGPEPAHQDERPRMRRFIVGVVLSILLGSGGISWYWLAHRPQSKKQDREPMAVPVEVLVVTRDPTRVTVAAAGTVMPARRLDLAPRVSGAISAYHPQLLPGGLLTAGSILATIDPTDLELDVVEAQAELARQQALAALADQQIVQRQVDLARAEASLRLEVGQQVVAQREAEVLDEVLTEADREFVLRRPQLAISEADRDAAAASLAVAKTATTAAQAATAAATAARQRATVDRDRCTITVPFDALVIQRHIEQGSQVTAGTTLASLVATDVFWLELSLPVADLRWITVPDGTVTRGSAVRLTDPLAWGADAFREGEVLSLVAEVEPAGRLARILVSLPDPLCRLPANTGKPRLILGTWLTATIAGTELPAALVIPRSALHDGNRIWVMQPDDTLDIRAVTIIRADQDTAVIGAGLEAGEHLIVSDLATPVQGMALRVLAPAGDKAPPPPVKTSDATTRPGKTP